VVDKAQILDTCLGLVTYGVLVQQVQVPAPDWYSRMISFTYLCVQQGGGHRGMHLPMKFVSISSGLPMTMGMQCSDEQTSWARKGLRGGEIPVTQSGHGPQPTRLSVPAPLNLNFFWWCFCLRSLSHAASVVSHFLHHDKQTLGK
jgi:hypothetical protein